MEKLQKEFDILKAKYESVKGKFEDCKSERSKEIQVFAKTITSLKSKLKNLSSQEKENSAKLNALKNGELLIPIVVVNLINTTVF